MSDKLRRAGLVRQRPVAPRVDAPEAVAPPLRATPVPPEPIAKPETKTIDLGNDYELKVTPSGDKIKVDICSKSGKNIVAVTPDAREIVDATIELEKNQSAQMYVSQAGSLSVLKITAGETEVSSTLNAVEALAAGKTREHAFSESDITGKAILLESGERLVYVKEHDAFHIFDKEGKVESLNADSTNEWVKEVGAYKVWYDPNCSEGIITVGHKDELAKIKEVEAREITFSATERTFGATKGVMKFNVAGEQIQVNVEVDVNGNLTSESKTKSRGRGIELEETDEKIRVARIIGRGPSSYTEVNEVWNAQNGNHIEILGSKVTQFRIVWNKITGVAHVTTYAPALDNLVGVIDSQSGVGVSNRSGRTTFNSKGENYELKVTRDQVMLTHVKAPQPAPRPVEPHAPAQAPRPNPAKEAEPKVVGAERAAPGAKTQAIKTSGNPAEAIEADDEKEEPDQGERTGGSGKRAGTRISLIAAAFGASYLIVRSLVGTPEPVQQTTPDSAVVIAPPPAPNIAPPPPVIAPPPIVIPQVPQQPVIQDSGAVTVRDATADTAPVRRRRSSTNSGGFGNFEGM